MQTYFQILRYILDISYNGSRYHGWQNQSNAHSVQAELNIALEKILRNKITTLGSGRTDTGVHAEQQMVQFDLEEEIDLSNLKYKLNMVLPYDIAINNVYNTFPGFNVRFDAKSRTYEYRIIRKKDVFHKDLFLFTNMPLDIQIMNQAAKLLLSYNDFKCFSKYKTSVDHFLCNIYRAEWREKDDILIFSIKANRFLRGMVRAIVGTLLNIGSGRMSIDEFIKVIESKKRKFAGNAVEQWWPLALRNNLARLDPDRLATV